MFVVAAFYHFFDFPDYAEQKPELLRVLKSHAIRGSILIATEGFNGTISGTREAIDAALAYLATLGGAFSHKEALHERQPFNRVKVRLKKELISLGEPTPSLTKPTNENKTFSNTGTYVSPQEWNRLIDDPDTLVLDTRNSYETHLGSFKNAIDPRTQTFKQLPAWVRDNLADKKKKKIATFCTGGIRCEKFTAWMQEEGFEEVYHLQGGILQYLEEIPPEQSRWEGECFVFDQRIAVGHGLAPSQTATMCYCGRPLTPQDRAHPAYVEGKRCGYCHKNHAAPSDSTDLASV